MTDFKLVSLNVRGLRSINKRKAFIYVAHKTESGHCFPPGSL